MSMKTPKEIQTSVDITISRFVAYELIKRGVANQLSINNIDIVKDVGITLFGSGLFIPYGIYLEANDLDFFVEFGFDNKNLDSAVSKLMRPDMSYDDLSNSELETISNLPQEDKNQISSLIKIFSIDVESFVKKVLRISKPEDRGPNYVEEIDITTDKMMFNSTAFSVDVGSVMESPFEVKSYNGVKYKYGVMSLEKTYIRKLTSGRDKDARHMPLLSKYVDLENIINTTRYLRRFNSNEVMEELVTNLLTTAYDFTQDENKVEEAYSQLKMLYQDIVMGSDDFESDHDVFPEDEHELDAEYYPYDNHSRSEDYDMDNLNDFWRD